MKKLRGAIRAARTIAATAVFVAGSAASLAAEPLRADFSNRLSLGYDSFIDRFTILDDDTAEAVHDFYAGLTNSLSITKGDSRLGVSNLFRYGNQTIDEAIDLDAGANAGDSWRIDLRSNFRYKHFREGNNYSSSNDYLQGNALLKVRKRFSDVLRAGVRARFELVDFEERTVFDYDYTYRDAGLEIEAGPDYSGMILLSGSYGRREAPDTTALGFDRIVGEIEAHGGSDNLSVHADLFADRRDYLGDVRSDRWSVMSNFEAMAGEINGRAVSIRAETDLLFYDRPDTAYFDSHFLRGGLRVRFPARGAALFIEPRYGQMLCRSFAEERYREISIIFGFDASAGERFWVTASYEPGYRDYTEPENYLYSDFIVNRISIMGSVTFAKDFSVNLFLNHEPETHSRREDDFSITLASIDLAWRF